MLSAATMGPSFARSSLEMMLDTIRLTDEQPKDHPPALPVRPTSRGRLPSARRSLIVSLKLQNGPTEALSRDYIMLEDKKEEQKTRDAKEVVFKSGIFGSKRMSKVEKPEESSYVKLPELVASEERMEVAVVEDSPPVPSPSAASLNDDLEWNDTIEYALKKDTTNEHPQVHPSVMAELQGRVLKTEAALGEKEEENAFLQKQLQQYEARWLEYEAKMKSMEQTWQKQLTSLQLSLAAARKSLAPDDMTSQPRRPDASPVNHYCDSEDTMSAGNLTPEGTPAKPICGLARNNDGTANAVVQLVKEFEQRRQVFEDDAGFLVEVKSGHSVSNINPDEELRKLKVCFTSWKKDYKSRLRETKMTFHKLGNCEEKVRKRCGGVKDAQNDACNANHARCLSSGSMKSLFQICEFTLF